MSKNENINVVLTVSMGELVAVTRLIEMRYPIMKKQVKKMAKEARKGSSTEALEKITELEHEHETLHSFIVKIRDTFRILKEVEKKS